MDAAKEWRRCNIVAEGRKWANRRVRVGKLDRAESDSELSESTTLESLRESVRRRVGSGKCSEMD